MGGVTARGFSVDQVKENDSFLALDGAFQGILDLQVSTRDSVQDSWSMPIDVNVDNLNKGGTAVVNTVANDAAPALSWDGKTVIFYSNKAGGLGGNDLYMSTRQKLNDSH